MNTSAKRLALADGGSLEYDALILATGATHSYFGHPEWEPLAPGLKTLEDAITIRRRVLLAYEAAERETDPARRAALLTFIVVGAGPTGVELAGALAEIARHVLAPIFGTSIRRRRACVLIEGGAARAARVRAGAFGEGAAKAREHGRAGHPGETGDRHRRATA